MHHYQMIGGLIMIVYTRRYGVRAVLDIAVRIINETALFKTVLWLKNDPRNRPWIVPM